jgi:chromosome segregation ATPase
MAKKIKTAKRTTKTKAQWELEVRELQDRIYEHLREGNAVAKRADDLASQLTAVRAELAKQTASCAHANGEADALKLAMRMLANTIIGKETFSSWPWQAPEAK